MKKIKLLFSAFAVLLLFLVAAPAQKAQALLFTLDLTGINANYGTYENIEFISVDGFADVTQSFGADGIFNDGDPFTEMAIFQKLSYKDDVGALNKFFTELNNENKFMYVYGEDITGTVFDVSGNFGDPNLTFKYDFDAGSGDIGIYIGDSDDGLVHNPANPTVAKFELLEGAGDGLDGFFEGQDNAGNTRLTAMFNQAGTPNGIWITSTGLDLGNLPSGFFATASINTTNTVEQLTLFGVGENSLYPETTGFTSRINSTGNMVVDAVIPEPTTLLLFATGLLGMAFLGRRKRL